MRNGELEHRLGGARCKPRDVYSGDAAARISALRLTLRCLLRRRGLHESARWNISSAVRAANCTVLTLAMRIIQISAPGLRHGGLARVELRDAHPGDAVAQISALRRAALCLPRRRDCTNRRVAGSRLGGERSCELRDTHPDDAVAQIGASRQAALCLPRQRGCTNQRVAGSRRGGERRYELRGATPATETARISASLAHGSAGRGAPDAMRCRMRKWEFV